MGIAFLVSILVLILNLIYLKVPKGRFKYLFITPVSFVSLFIVLYMVIGFNAYWQGDYYFLGTDLSYALSSLYEVTSVFIALFLLFFLFFYYSGNNYKFSYCNKDYRLINKYVYIYTFLSVAYSLFIINGIKIPLLHNFLGLFFNAGITLISYAFITRIRGSYFLLFLFSFLIIYLGFRYRLIFLFLPVILSLFIFRKLKALKLLKYALITFSAIFIVAVVGVARKYSDGLQLERLEGMKVLDILVNGIFNDTSTVLTSGAMVNWLDDNDSYAYLNQIWYVINYFIPNELYANKKYSPIFENISSTTGQMNNESGAAVLGFVEYYHTAGYYGIIIFALIFAFFLSKYFKKMVNSNSFYDHYVYFVLIAWYLNSLTRGYFPQNAQELVSIIIGLYLIKKFSKSYNVGSYNVNNDKCI